MYITDVEKYGKNKYKVSLETGDSFLVPIKVWDTLKINVSESVDDLQMNQWMTQYFLQKAKIKALTLLKTRDRTSMELKNSLKRSGYPNTVIEQTMAYIHSYHYLDDYNYAKNYIEYRSGSKSVCELKYELKKKGIDIKDMLETEENMMLPDDRKTIKKIMLQKCKGEFQLEREEKNKLIRYFARRGFKSEDIFSVMNELDI